MNVEEFEVPVPWGHIAGKGWGNDGDRKVLVFHGLMDNAGSFDRLIPLLPKTFHYLCFDLPGHGKSSHFPIFFPAYSLNHILAYRLIARHFKQEKYIIMGHSYGGQLGLLFAQVYPRIVEKLIMLDTVHLWPVYISNFGNYLSDRFDSTINLYEKLSKGIAPSYTYEKCLRKLQENRLNDDLTEEAAEALLQRSIIPTGDGKFRFSLDQRLKNIVNPVQDLRYVIETIKKNPISCPVLVLLGRESKLQQIAMKDLIKLYRSRRNFIVKLVDGGHDVHINTPELVAPDVTRFLLKQVTKL